MALGILMWSPSCSDGKESACNEGNLGQDDSLEKGMVAHSSILAWRILWTEEPGGLLSMGLQRFGHDCATNTFFLLKGCKAAKLETITAS